jgi:glycosyltransferase involved in cell wall biosynthesis
MEEFFRPKILFIAPFPPPFGGQAIMSEIVRKAINPLYVININVDGRILSNIIIIIKIIYYTIFRKPELIYFTCSRSKIGAIRDIILLYLARFLKIKTINHLHGNEIHDILHPQFFKRIVTSAYQGIDTTIFVSRRQAEDFPILVPSMDKVVLPNCYDKLFDDISWKQKKSLIHSSEVNILFISFLMESKGIFIALEVFERLAVENSHLMFNVAGDFRTDYLSSASEVRVKFFNIWNNLTLRFPGRFIYHGVVTGQLKRDLFLKNDILFFPTFFKTESFGLVIIEAMRSGNVVIASDFNNISELVNEERGKLFIPKDSENAVLAIKYFIDNMNKMREVQRSNMMYSETNYSQSKFDKRVSVIFEKYLQK